MISRSLFEDSEPHFQEEIKLDQYYFEHSNHLILFGIAATHDLFDKVRQGLVKPETLQILFDRKGKSSKIESTQKISGKKKLNAVFLDRKTMVCEIRCDYSDLYH
mmetsp:Transcript_11318/g.19055  ORF Transcript_11318/g.19055 Transcript_11318/m.19055 type:complete len:105 (+) Transcript_11318:248-562(+)|eukprot:CAMPEP_0168608888 /NCGR_PEP_ID=MMETSP0449_2-20121227/894_1 /TAXON_ID=1082188 /ORGANISM="Strombidium rassoulzadegani, Strain ras09" /LENGTH=104 /DNA_ID=CAMNT_0008648957 /DNA_START=167 /DNA_END=484 /DNA_ORIENTATION=-